MTVKSKPMIERQEPSLQEKRVMMNSGSRGADVGRSSRRVWQVAAAAMVAAMVSACGGGGGGGGPDIAGVTALSGITPPVYDSTNTQVAGGELTVKMADGRSLVRGESGVVAGVAIEIEKHPLNQLCRVVVNGAQSTVACTQTLINDTGLPECFQDGVKAECGSGGVAAAAFVSGGPLAAAGVSMGALALQDGAKGRDPETARLRKLGCGARGFDFSRLNAAGKALLDGGGCPTPSATDADWICTRDNVTGLVWLREPGVAASFDSARTAPLPTCGQKAWRLPTTDELASLINSGSADVAIDRARFPGVEARAYWTGSRSQRDSAAAYAVLFSAPAAAPGGSVQLLDKRDAYPVLWVSDTTRDEWRNLRVGTNVRRFEPDFVKGVITDRHSGLMWMLCSLGRTATRSSVGPCSGSAADFSWDAALEEANKANQGAGSLGYSDWRLPNRAELVSLVDYSGDRVVINADLRTDTQNINGDGVAYWTGSGVSGADGRTQAGAFLVEFKDGTVSVSDRRLTYRVRLVRSLP